MNNARRLLITFLLAIPMTFGLAACGQDEQASEAPQDASEADSSAQTAEDSLAAVESMESTEAESYDEEMPVGAEVFFVSPTDGSEVGNPVKVVFGVEGMEVAPAGTQTPGTGHHHLLVDVDEMPDLSKPIPSDDNHIHFGKGQTEVELELEPGEHTLQLLFADGNHVPHDPPVMSDPITITVVEQE